MSWLYLKNNPPDTDRLNDESCFDFNDYLRSQDDDWDDLDEDEQLWREAEELIEERTTDLERLELGMIDEEIEMELQILLFFEELSSTEICE